MDYAAVELPLLGLLGVEGTYLRLVLEAGLFAKFILLLLLTLSVISWGVALDKWTLFKRVEAQARDIRTATVLYRLPTGSVKDLGTP